MSKPAIPYLCGGTFLTQLIRANAQKRTNTDYTNGLKESLTENETFRRLISIFHLGNFHSNGDSLKTYTSGYKRCTQNHATYPEFLDHDLRRNFDEDVKSDHSIALYMMSEFVSELTDDKKGAILCRCLLDMLLQDPDIDDDITLYISKQPVKYSKLKEIRSFDLPYFLLGIWHFIIMNRSESNTKGAATYNEWYPRGKDYMGTIGDGIDYNIEVLSSVIPKPETKSCQPGEASDSVDSSSESQTQQGAEYSNTQQTENPNTVTQYINNQTIVYQKGDHNTQIGYVGVLNL